MESDDSAKLQTPIAYQRGNATETSDLSSDNESIHSINSEYTHKPRKYKLLRDTNNIRRTNFIVWSSIFFFFFF